jgi:pimeloyl-ACP methyl ester carboxylesterase
MLSVLAVTVAASAAILSMSLSGVAQASAPLPVSYNFIAAAVANTSPATPPPGANNWSCKPSWAHPYPVILVHGTAANMDDNWQAASPVLANHGYCVFAFNYGNTDPTASIQGTGEIGASAAQLSTFVNQVLAATGTSKVDLVGHSEGGMMPRYYINFLGGASKVHTFVALAPSNYGTGPGGILGLIASSIPDPVCEACTEQIAGSAFLARLNATPTMPGVNYTVVESKDDEIISPYTNAFLPAALNVTNITVQDVCSLDATDHIEIEADPVTLALMLNALDPASPVQVPCIAVQPYTGPTGTVPSF